MKFLTRIYLFIICAIPTVIAVAQTPFFHIQHFGTEYGIRTFAVRKIIKDKKGFIWILHLNRVQRFDGRRTVDFYFQDRLASIVTDVDDRIWVSSRKKIYRFVNQQKGFEEASMPSSKDISFGPLFKTKDEKLWILSNNNFYSYHSLKQLFEKKEILKPHEFKKINLSAMGVFGYYVFLDMNDSIQRVHLLTGEKTGFPLSNIAAISVLDKNRIIASTWDVRSFIFDFENNTSILFNPGILQDKLPDPLFRVKDIERISNDVFLISSFQGFFRFSQSTQKLSPLILYKDGKPYYNAEPPEDLIIDEDSTCWAVSIDGIYHFQLNQKQVSFFRNASDKTGQQWSNQVRHLIEDDKGNIWFSTINGFVKWNVATGETTPFFAQPGNVNALQHPSVRGVAWDGKKIILGPTDGGVLLFDPVNLSYERPHFEKNEKGNRLRRQSENDFIDDIVTLKNGDHVILGRDNGYLLNGKNYTVTEWDIPGKNENLNALFTDSKKRFWIATLKSVYCTDSNRNQLLHLPFNERSRYPVCFAEPFQGVIWIGTTSGLFSFNTSASKEEIKPVNDFFLNKWIMLLYKDAFGKIWIGTDDGLYMYIAATKSFEKFDVNDNIKNKVFEVGSYCMSRDGTLYLGGYNGINYFKPSEFTETNYKIKPVITGISFGNNNNDSLLFSGKPPYQLSYSQNSFTVQFTAPYFRNAEKIVYRYFLTGVDTGWVSLGNSNTLRFTSLSPGAYQLKIAASTNGINWFETDEPVSFFIQSPFWKKWWFTTIITLPVLLLIYFRIRTLQQNIRSQKTLNYFATSLYGRNNVEDVFWDVAKNCIQHLHFEDCVLYQYDSDKKVLLQKAAFGPKNPDGHFIQNPIAIPLGKGICGSVAITLKAEIVNDTRKDPRYIVDDEQRRSEITVPVLVDGKLFGILDSEHSKKNFFTKQHLKTLRGIAAIAGEKISKHLIEEKLRTQIARDLHDEMGSTLTSINILSKMAAEKAGDTKAKEYMQRIKEHSSNMMESMSDMVWAINPANDSLSKVIVHMKELAAELLEPAGINYFFIEKGTMHNLHTNLLLRKDFYLVFKEALNNCAKYSGATEVKITIEYMHGHLTMQITDNGTGFDTSKESSGNGLKNMKARSEEINGQLNFHSVKGSGTSVHLSVPIT